jgi:hypothetical protein
MFKASEIHRLMSLTESYFSEVKGITLQELLKMEQSAMIKVVRSMDALKDKPILTKRVFEGIAMIKWMESHGGKVRNQELKALEKVFPFKDVQAAMSAAVQAYNKKIGYDPISMTQKKESVEERMMSGAAGNVNFKPRGAGQSTKKPMKADDEKKIAILRAQLLNTPLAQKQKIMDQIAAIQSRYESKSVVEGSEKIRSALVSAITQYDKKQLAKAKWHNPNALNLYLDAVDATMSDYEKTNDLEKSLRRNFNDRLLDWMLKAAKPYMIESKAVKGKWAQLAESHFQMEGGPGSGGQYLTRKFKMPMSPYISVGTRKGILKNMPFDLEDVPLSKITHVAQAKFVPQKVKNLCKNPDVITKYPVCLLKIPSQDCYHVMDGHHRFLAAQKLGIENLPAKVWLKYEEEPAPVETPSEPAAEGEPLPLDQAPGDQNPDNPMDMVPAEAMPLPEPEAAPEPNPATLVPDDSANAMSEIPSEVPSPDGAAPDAVIPAEHDHYEVMCEKCQKVTESCGCMAEEKVKRTTVCEACKSMSFIESKKLPMSLKEALKVLGSKGSF